jgi:hypothetical protein
MRISSAVGLLLLAACGSEEGSSSSALTRPPGACGDIETHVIGEWGGDGDTGSGGDSTVILERQGHHVLVLSAHDATSWHIQTMPGAVLEHVFVTGYHAQKVDGVPAGVDVVMQTHDDGQPYAIGFQYPNHDTQSLLTLTSAVMHHDPTSFHGCHTAGQWVIGADMGVTSDCATVQADAVTNCGHDTGTCGTHGGSNTGSSGGSNTGSNGGSNTGSGNGSNIIL